MVVSKEIIAAMNKAVPYYRVSTTRQGESGLGLEAQQKSVQDFALANSLTLLKEFTEIQPGGKIKRPVLQKALDACKRQGAVLLIARLDRLARSVFLVSKLLESKIKFIAVDMPYADKFVVQILSAVAEKARDDISVNTKQALQAAKNRGVELGKHVKYTLSKQNKEAANAFACKMEPVIAGLKERGFKSVRQISDELNRLKVPTYRGRNFRWHPYTVHNILARMPEN